MIKKYSPIATLLFVAVALASDVFFVESLGYKIWHGILAVLCAIACYGEFRTIKNK